MMLHFVHGRLQAYSHLVETGIERRFALTVADSERMALQMALARLTSTRVVDRRTGQTMLATWLG